MSKIVRMCGFCDRSAGSTPSTSPTPAAPKAVAPSGSSPAATTPPERSGSPRPLARSRARRSPAPRSLSPRALSAVGVCCAAALAAPVLAAGPAAAQDAGARPAAAATKPSARAAVPGSTQSLPLRPLADDRALGSPAAQGLARQKVRPFALLGVVWDDPDAELVARVEVRTRDTRTGRWTGWQQVSTHNHEHAADPASAERESGALHGGTAPLWVGTSDGVEVRVRPGGEVDAHTGHRHERQTPDPAGGAALPEGLRLELVDPGSLPGEDTATAGRQPAGGAGLTAAETLVSRANQPLAALGATEVPARSAAEVRAEQGATDLPYAAPQPRIVTRKGWGADESIREKDFLYTDTVKAMFVHHTASGNDYECAEAPALIRGIYRYHVQSEGWRDIGYNFLVDKCGTVYEGRAGGVAKPVMGAHTLGFNENSAGVAVLGTHTDDAPAAPVLDSLKKLTAWKLGLHGADPAGTTELVSGGGNRYPKGQKVRLHTISGHRDGFSTECPGEKLYEKLGEIREGAAAEQGREPTEESPGEEPGQPGEPG